MSPEAPRLSVETKSTERLSLTRKLIMLSVFCSTRFLDAFNNTVLFPTIPALTGSMAVKQGQSAWIISAFQLTSASFLLISGRISDLYNPKNVFITGLSLLGIISLCAGFVNNKIVLIVLSALMGIASAMTMPSALALLVHVFPDPLEQARALGVFGVCGASADLIGLVIGAVFVQDVSYRWVFWLVAILSIPMALGCIFIIPSKVTKPKSKGDLSAGSAKWKSLDLIGISILTVAFILFIYGVSSGSASGWTTAEVLIPLMVSILLTVGFFYWETLVPFEKAVIPPRTWFYKNFSVLVGLALLPFFWWNAILMDSTTLWKDDFHWTAISIAGHMTPLGLAALAVGFTGSLIIGFPKFFILAGLDLALFATYLLALRGRAPGDYSNQVAPAFVIGSAGIMLIYTHANIAIFQIAPSSMAGTVGAIFNGALQFGSAIGLAAFCSIERDTPVESIQSGVRQYPWRSAAFGFLFGAVLIERFSVGFFYTDGDGAPKKATGKPK